MVKCTKGEVRRLKTALRWKGGPRRRQRIQMVLLRPCPYCAGRMIIIETFARSCEPKHEPTPAPAEIRIDTS